MICYVDNNDITHLIKRAVINGSKTSCARVLAFEVVQSPIDDNLDQVYIETGKKVQFSADGMEFFGVVSRVTRSTASTTLTVTAQDMGLYLKRNSITCKIKGCTPKAVARTLCSGRGIRMGYMADCDGFIFSRNFSGVTLYSAIMTGYTLASEKTGKKYQMVFDGSLMCIVERGVIIGGTIRPKENLMTAAYSEDIENVTNRVYMYDTYGNAAGSIESDTSIGIMGQALTLTDNCGIDYARKILRDKKIARTGTVDILGNANCITGNAALVYEPYTGLYGKFYIDADTHTWTDGKYTTKLTLNFENTMDEQQAGSELKKSESKEKEKSEVNSKNRQEQDEKTKPKYGNSGWQHVGPHGEVIYVYP